MKSELRVDHTREFCIEKILGEALGFIIAIRIKAILIDRFIPNSVKFAEKVFQIIVKIDPLLPFPVSPSDVGSLPDSIMATNNLRSGGFKFLAGLPRTTHGY